MVLVEQDGDEDTYETDDLDTAEFLFLIAY